jgi:hypothetical protein
MALEYYKFYPYAEGSGKAFMVFSGGCISDIPGEFKGK